MGLLALGILLLLVGLSALALALPALGWALIAFGAIFAVTRVAVGPERRRPTLRTR